MADAQGQRTLAIAGVGVENQSGNIGLYRFPGLVNPANREVLVPLGPLSLYRQGVLIGLLTAARLSDLIGATFLFSFTTRPADLAETLMQHGLSPRFGYVVQWPHVKNFVPHHGIYNYARMQEVWLDRQP